MPASGPRRRSRAVIKPVKAETAGNPQVKGLEIALAFCTRTRGNTNTALLTVGVLSLAFR